MKQGLEVSRRVAKIYCIIRQVIWEGVRHLLNAEWNLLGTTLKSCGNQETTEKRVRMVAGNAIFDATGQRLRSLPMAPGRLGAGNGSRPAAAGD